MNQQGDDAELRNGEAQNAGTERCGAVEKGFLKVASGECARMPTESVMNRDGDEDIEDIAQDLCLLANGGRDKSRRF